MYNVIVAILFIKRSFTIAQAINDTSILIVPEQGFIIITEKLSETKGENPVSTELVKSDFGDVGTNALPDQESTAAFSHKIVDRNNVLMATAKATVTGWYSQMDNWSELTDITASFIGDFASNFSYSTSYSGNTGYLNLYFNGMGAGVLTYRISTNGKIANI